MKLMNVLKFSSFGLLLILTGCQDWEVFHFSKPNSLELKNQLRFGLFTQKDEGPLNMRVEKVGPQEPKVLWTLMRQKFNLEYPDNHPRVKQYIKEYTKTNYHMNQLSKNASPYLFMIVEEVDKRGLPLELALLPMVESNFNPLAVSPSGAEGLWQIMPATGSILGLKQDFWYDGRKDIKASTIGALSHLQYLNRLFEGDWLLALAAYNCGERRVLRAIQANKKKNLPTDFWHLNLPKETQNYVPKLLALCQIVKNPTHHKVNLPDIANEPRAQLIKVHHQIDLDVAAQLSSVSLDELVRLNPALHHGATHPKGPHQVMVPSYAADNFMKKVRRFNPEELTSHQLYVVHTGDTLSSIADKFGSSAHAIKITNDFHSDSLHPGTTLFIPSNKIVVQSPPLTHVVKKGDSLWSISKKYKVELKDLAAWNQLGKKAIQPGQELVIKKV